MNKDNKPGFFDVQTRALVTVLAMAVAIVSSGCAGPRAFIKGDCLADSTGWVLRDVDDQNPPRWVAYERDATIAAVKEIRVVGMVSAEPESVARALRRRLLDESKIPEGMERRVIRTSEVEVEYYAINAMPFPFDDREVTERLRFTHDAQTGIYVVDVENVDTGDPTKPGVLRIPTIKNRMVITPAGPGRSSVTMDSVHDMGGNFPNWAIYQAVADSLVDEVEALNQMTGANDETTTTTTTTTTSTR